MTTLVLETEIAAPIERCFDLMRSVDVHLLSARAIRARAEGGRTKGLSTLGDETAWSAVFFGWRFRLSTRITHFAPPHRFADELSQGLFRKFGHGYSFEPAGDGRTRVTDRFFFESPAGWLFDRYLLQPQMQRAVAARGSAVKRLAESGAWEAFLP